MNRRRFVLVAGTAGMVGVAGCLGFGDDDENGDGDDEDGNGDANGDENGDENGGEDGDTNGDTNGDENGDENGGEDGDTNGDENGDTNGDENGEEPGVTFEWEPENPSPGEQVTFDVSGLNDGRYQWDFTGDGTFDQTTRTPTTTYTFEDESGPRVVTLRVQNEDGETTEVTESVPVGDEVGATFDIDPPDPVVGETVTFDATASAVSDGSIVEYRWDFTDDGEFDETTTDPVVTRTFEQFTGTAVTLEIEDDTGRTGSVERELAVQREEEPLNAVFVAEPEEPDVGETVTFEIIHEQGGDIVEYRWDFTGDGEFNRVTADPETVTHTYEQEGQRTATLEVETVDGETAISSEAITVGTPGPDFGASFEWTPETPSVGETVTFDITNSFGDIVEFRWDFTDDGDIDATTTEPESVTHTYDEAGTYSVSLLVEDASGEVRGFVGSVDVQD